MSVAVATLAVVAVLVFRLRRFHGGLDQYVTQQEFPLGPLGLALGMFAGAFLHRKRKPKLQNQASEAPSEPAPRAVSSAPQG